MTPNGTSEPTLDLGLDVAGGKQVRVLLPVPAGQGYDYLVPPDLDVTDGDFVLVPLGPRQVFGVVWGAGSGQVAPGKLKNIIGLADVPPMPESLRGLIEWTARYTLSPPGAVLKMAMSVPRVLEPDRPRTGYRLADPAWAAPESAASESAVPKPTQDDGANPFPIRLTDARRRVLLEVGAGPPRAAADIAREAAVTPGVVRGMAKAGVLIAVPISPPVPPLPEWAREGPRLSADQSRAAAALCTAAGKGASVTVLDGVTGSGKTEVYFEAIAEVLKAGKQALVMLPEIALTADWLARFKDRFGVRPTVWHSELAAGERRASWRAVLRGDAKIVVGARSALFLPFPDLGLIVVDEEHDPSYKQEDGVIYNARDMAVVRGRLAEFPVVLASATPSLETFTNMMRGRYERLHLHERHGGASLPEIITIDMRAEQMERQSWLSPTLRAGLEETLDAGEQAMLFLNRRGYAPLTLCRTCGHRLECPNCTAWLVDHRQTARLSCHHCGHTMPPPPDCPECGAEDSFAACGPGVERLAEEVHRLFPAARTAIMASDTIHGPRAATDLLRRMADHEIDILIGTQVVAKGHNFPMLTLVGVVDADLGLGGGDLRAGERTYQLLRQVAGRAGRAQHPGRVMLQTYMPDHPVMTALGMYNRDEFYAAEASVREARRMPPFGRLAGVIVSGQHESDVDAVARALGRTAPRGEDVSVLGPAPAPMAILRGRHRRRLLLKASLDIRVQDVLRAWVSQVKPPGGVRIQVDIDPYSFM